MTATVTVPRDDDPLSGAAFLEPLVARLHAEYGVDREQLRRLAAQALAIFATARVRTFVPLLVEKRLRETCRGLRGVSPASRAGTASGGRPAVAGRHRG